MVSEYFSAYTSDIMQAGDNYLPLCRAAESDLVKLLGEDGYTFLTILDDTNMEAVKVTNDHGTLVVERGLEGTKAVAHPAGACVKSVSPAILAAIKDLVCNYDCCSGDCVCAPVSKHFVELAPAKAGQQWSGAILFDGTPPVTCGVGDLPAWVSAKAQGSAIILSGTAPAKASETTISFAATNCSGTAVHTGTAKIIVSA